MAASAPDGLAPRIHTPLCDLLQITHPIVLGGMASGTSAPLVAAVSNGGGLGTLGASGRSPTEIREATARIRDLTTAPFGLNVLLFYHDEETLETVLAQRPAVAAFAWPTAEQSLDDVFARAHDVGAHVMHMASRLDEAVRAAEAGADIIVAQGSEGGGHVGVMSTMVLVPQVVAAVAPKLVLAAGGIATGRQMAAALALGAEGVWCGSVWLTTNEAETSPAMREKFIAASSADTRRSRSLTGKPARMLRSAWTDAWETPDAPAPLGMPLQSVLVADSQRRIHRVAHKAESGARELVTYFVGQVGGQMNEVKSSRRVVGEMIEEFVDTMERLNALVSGD